MQSFAEGGPSTEAAQQKARGYGLDGSETDFYREDFHRIRAKVLMRDDFYLVPVIRHYQTAGGVIYAGLPSRDDKAFIVAPNNLRSHHAFTRRYFWVFSPCFIASMYCSAARATAETGAVLSVSSAYCNVLLSCLHSYWHPAYFTAVSHCRAGGTSG